jgi:hypothetical protein
MFAAALVAWMLAFVGLLRELRNLAARTGVMAGVPVAIVPFSARFPC